MEKQRIYFDMDGTLTWNERYLARIIRTYQHGSSFIKKQFVGCIAY